MTDHELLELAARAAGYSGEVSSFAGMDIRYGYTQAIFVDEIESYWNPLEDDGDALRLAVRLNLDIRYESYDAGVAVIVGGAWDGAPESVHEIFERDGPRAVRRAIVRAAAEIGRAMP